VDVLFVSEDTCKVVREMASKTGLTEDNIFLFASHTHSGPMTTGLFGHDDEADYVRHLEQKISEAIIAAWEKMQSAQLGIGKTSVPGLSANARYLMKNGRIETHPWKGDPDIVAPEGPVDDEMFGIVVKNEVGELIGGLFNYANHPQILEREKPMISADFPGRVERYVREKLGDNVTVLFGNGACGNLCPVDPLKTDRIEVGVEWLDHTGSVLADRFTEIFMQASCLHDTRIATITTHVPIIIRSIPHSSTADARAFLKEHGDETDRDLKVSNYGTEAPDSGFISLGDYLETDEWKRQGSRDLLNLMERKIDSPVVDVALTALRIGDVAIVMLPFELFTELGMEIKKRSPYKNTLVIELANGALGYVPTQEAFKHSGGYETLTLTSSQLVPTAAEIVVEESIGLLAALQ
jgi:hypothetical protein